MRDNLLESLPDDIFMGMQIGFVTDLSGNPGSKGNLCYNPGSGCVVHACKECFCASGFSGPQCLADNTTPTIRYATTSNLTAALASAANGDTLYLAAGTYSAVLSSGPIVLINRTLTLMRDPAAPTSPVFRCKTVLFSSTTSCAFSVRNGSTITLRGITINACGKGGIATPSRSAIEVGFEETVTSATVGSTTKSRVTLIDCVLSDNGKVLDARNSAQIIISGSQIANNGLVCCTSASFPNPVDMMLVTGQLTIADSAITGNTGHNSLFSDSGRSSKIDIRNVTILDNAGPLGIKGYPSSKMMSLSTGSIRSCRVAGNKYFAMIVVFGTAKIADSSFSAGSREGEEGSALDYVRMSTAALISITNCVFNDSRPLSRGLIYSSDSTEIVIANVSFQGIHAIHILYLDNPMTRLEMSDCVIRDSSVRYVLNLAITSPLEISERTVGLDSVLRSVVIVNNTAENIIRAVDYLALLITRTNFVGNRAGNMITFSGTSRSTLEDCSILSNTLSGIIAMSGQTIVLFESTLIGPNAVTSAVTLEQNAIAHFTNSHITGLSSYVAVVSAAGSSSCNLVNTTFDANNAFDSEGTLVYVSGQAVLGVFRCTLQGNLNLNTCSFAESAKVYVSESLFLDNYATEGGGFRCSGGASVAVVSSSFSGNRAQSGGALGASGLSRIALEETRFIASPVCILPGNTAEQGGAVWLRKSSSLVCYRECAFIGNTALVPDSRSSLKGAGGAIRLQESAIFNATESNITGNAAQGVGGGVYVEGSATVLLVASALTDNQANGTDGGALFSAGHALIRIESTLLLRNAGAFAGGALCVWNAHPDDLHCDECTFANNSAAEGADLYVTNPRAIPVALVAAYPLISKSSRPATMRIVNVASVATSYYSGAISEVDVKIVSAFGSRSTLPDTSPAIIRISVSPTIPVNTLSGSNGTSSLRARLSGDTIAFVTGGLAKLVYGVVGNSGTYVITVSGGSDSTVGVDAVGLPITITECPQGRVPVARGTDDLESCEVASASSAAASSVSTLPVALGVSLPVVAVALVGCFLIVRWQLNAARKKNSEAVQQKFVAEHMSKIPELCELEIDRSRVQLLGELGQGEFGVVYQARVATSGGRPRVCAAKSVKTGATLEDRLAFISEAKIMHGLSHPHVISLCGVVTREEPMLALLEYAAYGNLRSFVRTVPIDSRSSHVTASMFATFAHQIACGMAYLASVSIVHRDLAARNILVGSDLYGELCCKIADFGLSRSTGEKDYYRKRKAGALPIKWCAIENLRFRVYTTKSDVWSYGVTLFEIYSFGEVPYAGIHNAEMAKYLAGGPDNRMERPPHCPNSVYRIMRSCWLDDPDQRPSFSALCDALERERDKATAMGVAKDLDDGDNCAYAQDRVPGYQEQYEQYAMDAYTRTDSQAAVSQDDGARRENTYDNTVEIVQV
eukprot:Opistho-2@4070